MGSSCHGLNTQVTGCGLGNCHGRGSLPPGFSGDGLGQCLEFKVNGHKNKEGGGEGQGWEGLQSTVIHPTVHCPINNNGEGGGNGGEFKGRGSGHTGGHRPVINNQLGMGKSTQSMSGINVNWEGVGNVTIGHCTYNVTTRGYTPTRGTQQGLTTQY